MKNIPQSRSGKGGGPHRGAEICVTGLALRAFPSGTRAFAVKARAPGGGVQEAVLGSSPGMKLSTRSLPNTLRSCHRCSGPPAADVGPSSAAGRDRPPRPRLCTVIAPGTMRRTRPMLPMLAAKRSEPPNRCSGALQGWRGRFGPCWREWRQLVDDAAFVAGLGDDGSDEQKGRLDRIAGRG